MVALYLLLACPVTTRVVLQPGTQRAHREEFPLPQTSAGLLLHPSGGAHGLFAVQDKDVSNAGYSLSTDVTGILTQQHQ